MARYQPIQPWCELVLGERMPLALKGASMGLSLLFPMEKLFESYVSRALAKQMGCGYQLRAQPRQHALAQHCEKSMFQLEPDLLVHKGAQAVCVLDCKWKRIDQTQAKDKYGIQQSDMYQMLAYGSTYLQGQGELYLVYPRWAQFEAALPVFQLPQHLQLHVVPFDLDNNKLQLAHEAVFLPSIKAPA